MISVLFENDDFAVCVKPVGIASQNDSADDMVKLLSSQLNCKIYPVHRLDTAVGGTMIFAKNSATASALSKEISNGRFTKKYLAVINGTPEQKTGTMEDLLFKDSRKNKSFVVKRERKGVKKAKLDYTVLETAEDITLVKIKLHTGRSHQIRVQFSSRKMPLVGDGKYGGSDNRCSVALWSYSVSFRFKNENFSFSSAPPESYPWNIFINSTELLQVQDG